MATCVPTELKHVVLHPSTAKPGLRTGLRPFLKQVRRPKDVYSFKCTPSNSFNLLQHVFIYNASSKYEEDLLLKCAQYLSKLDHFTLMTILRYKLSLKKREIIFIVPNYKGIYLSEHVFVAAQNNLYLYEEELWAIFGQLLLFCTYLLSISLQIAEVVCTHLSMNNIYYVSSLPHMEDTRGCIKIDIMSMLLRESISLDSLLHDDTEDDSSAFMRDDIMRRLLEKVHTIMTTLTELQSTAHTPMGLPPSLMTPVQMNRVLSTVFNKRHQRSNTDMGSMLSINTSDFLSSISLSQVSNYARTKHKCQPSEATESKKNSCDTRPIHKGREEDYEKSDKVENSFLSMTCPSFTIPNDESFPESVTSKDGPRATVSIANFTKNSNPVHPSLPRHILVDQEQQENPNTSVTGSNGTANETPSLSIQMESMIGVGDLSMVDTEYNFGMQRTQSQVSREPHTDRYSQELHNAISMLRHVSSIREMYRVVPLAKVVDQLELLYSDSDKVRQASLRYAIITDNFHSVKRLVRKLPLDEKSTPTEISYCTNSYCTTEIMAATLLRNDSIIKALVPYQSNLLIINKDPSKVNALSMAIQNYVSGDTISYIARHSRPIIEKYWDTIVVQACLTKASEIITALVPFYPGKGALYFTKVCMLLGSKQLAATIFSQESDAIKKDNATDIIREVLFDHEAILNRTHSASSKIETTADGYTRFIFAAAAGNLELCKACVHEAGVVTKANDSAYLRALQNEHWDVVQYLETLKDSLPEQMPCTAPEFYADKEKEVTTLMSAASTYDIPRMRKFFSQAGSTDVLKMTALMFACDRENVEGALMLMQKEAGARCSATVWFSGFEFNGASALMFSVANNNLTLVKMLMNTEARLQDRNGRTALMAAARFGHLSIIRLLSPLEAGICDNRGKCAIHYAAEYRQREASALLAQVEGLCKDAGGFDVIEYYIRFKDFDFADILEYIITTVKQPAPHAGIPYREQYSSESAPLRMHLGSALTAISTTSLPKFLP